MYLKNALLDVLFSHFRSHIYIYIYIYIYCLLYLVDQCLDRFVDSSLLQFRAGTNPDRTVHSLNNEIRIIPHIEFKCNTIITSVILGIDVRPVEEGMRSKNRNRFPSVQVWRPTGDESEYKLLAGSERFVVYTPANVSRTGVHEYPLIPSVSVAPGDMIAISQPAGGESVVRCYSIELNNFNSYELDSGTTMKDLPPDEDKIVNNELVLIYPVTGMKIKYAIYNISYCRIL